MALVITIDDIHKMIAEECGLTLEQLRSDHLDRHANDVRKAGMYLLYTLAKKTFLETAQEYGLSTRKPASDAVRNFPELRGMDSDLAASVDRICQRLLANAKSQEKVVKLPVAQVNAPALTLKPIADCAITIEDIQSISEKEFGISHDDLLGDKTAHDYARARQTAMYFSFMAGATYYGMVKPFQRDHSSIMHNIKHFHEFYAADNNFAQKVEKIRTLLSKRAQILHTTFPVKIDPLSPEFIALGDTSMIDTDRRIKVADIQKLIVKEFGVTQADLLSEKRTRAIARARQAGMYFAYLAGKSYGDIGERFGGRHHTTALHAVQHIAEFCAEDPDFADKVERVRAQLMTRAETFGIDFPVMPDPIKPNAQVLSFPMPPPVTPPAGTSGAAPHVA